MGRFFRDLISNEVVATSEDLVMDPYEMMWLDRD
jgi:hypothetical protein